MAELVEQADADPAERSPEDAEDDGRPSQRARLEEAAPASADANVAAADDDDEPMCRYCFDGGEDEPLVSPCACRGDQKYVHLSCLRRWQRMVLVAQPTHPAFYADDVRHHKCNVCASPFTIAPPARHELMASFTGPEIAALIEPRCLIGAHDVFTRELERQLVGRSARGRAAQGYAHWIRGAYLITAVVEDDGCIRVPVRDASTLERVRALLLQNDDNDDENDETGGAAGGAADAPLTLRLRGEQRRLVAQGSARACPRAGCAPRSSR